MPTLKERVVAPSRTARAALGNVAARTTPRVGPGWRRARLAWSVVTPAGRAVLALGLTSWLLAWRLGWDEMAVLACGCLLLLLVGAAFLVGRTHLAVVLRADPPRVRVGGGVAGTVEVTNLSKAPLLPLLLEVPAGDLVVPIELKAMAPGSTRETEVFIVPTERRGVVEVGPATSVRGDPVGLFRRELTWTDAIEVFVHPETIQLAPFGEGLMRDLEGDPSANISASDLEFHALRKYVPGDDLRHVHWRATAHHGGELQVRQFLDTRRKHLTIIVDSRADSYDDEDEYETAISVGASIIERGLKDEYDVSFLSGVHAMTRRNGRSALDVAARAVPSPDALVSVAARGTRLAPDTSVVFLVTGPHPEFRELQRAAGQFPVDVGRAVLRVDRAAEARLRRVGEVELLTVPRLGELPRLLRWGMP